MLHIHEIEPAMISTTMTRSTVTRCMHMDIVTAKPSRVQTPGYVPPKTVVFWVHPPKKPTLLL